MEERRENMRGISRIALALICAFLLASYGTAYATTDPLPDAEAYATNYLLASAGRSISGGTAAASAKITGKVGKTTKTSVHMYLQQYKGGKWTNVADWASSGNTVSRSISKTKSVTKGYKYRTKAVCYAYAGSSSEKVTKYSKTVSY